MNGICSLSPSRTVVTSFSPRRPSIHCGSSDLEDGDWVLCLAADHSSNSLACALSNGELQVYDTQRLHLVKAFPSQGYPATDLIYGPQSMLVTTGQDGSLRVHDLRQESTALHAQLPTGHTGLSLSLGYDGYIAAIGSNKARVHFYDLRNAGHLLGTYVDAHTDEVTQVKFRSNSPYLLTASEDNLVCIFDTSQPTEETAVKSVLNVNAPPRHVGFCGTNESMLYCLTGSESLSLWDLETTSCTNNFGVNFRDYLTLAAHKKLNVDYLVDAHWDNIRQEMVLLAGDSLGDIGIFRLASQRFEASQILMHGHRGVVRAYVPMPDGKFITVGEDARICEWSPHIALDTRHAITNDDLLNGVRKRSLSHGDGSPMHKHRHKDMAPPY